MVYERDALETSLRNFDVLQCDDSRECFVPTNSVEERTRWGRHVDDTAKSPWVVLCSYLTMVCRPFIRSPHWYASVRHKTYCTTYGNLPFLKILDISLSSRNQQAAFIYYSFKLPFRNLTIERASLFRGYFQVGADLGCYQWPLSAVHEVCLLLVVWETRMCTC